MGQAGGLVPFATWFLSGYDRCRLFIPAKSLSPGQGALFSDMAKEMVKMR